jgi:CxxH/CxxC protein (TIGR04129 family)
MKSLKEKNKHCCEEHLDLGFDDFLAEFETFPVMREVDNESCSYCSKMARYVLELSEDKT